MPGQKKLIARTNWQVRKNDLALPIAKMKLKSEAGDKIIAQMEDVNI